LSGIQFWLAVAGVILAQALAWVCVCSRRGLYTPNEL
jgi:hypothetical protein